MMAPLDRGVIFVAKLASNLALMACVTTVVTPAPACSFSGSTSPPLPGRLSCVISVGMLGFAAIGTLFSAVVSSSRLQGGLLAMSSSRSRFRWSSLSTAIVAPHLPRRRVGGRSGLPSSLPLT